MQGVKGGCKPSIMNAKFQEALIRSGMVNITGMEKGWRYYLFCFLEGAVESYFSKYWKV